MDAVIDLQRRQARLVEMERVPLPEATAAARAVVDEFRQSGRVSRSLRERLGQALEALPESDQNAVLDWLEQQMRIEQRRQVPPAPSREELAPAPGL